MAQKIPDDKLIQLRSFPIHYRLQQLRLIAGLTQDELAAELKTTQANISTWESGRVIPSGRKLRQIIAFYDLPEGFFLDYAIEKIKLKKKKEEEPDEENENLYFGEIENEAEKLDILAHEDKIK